MAPQFKVLQFKKKGGDNVKVSDLTSSSNPNVNEMAALAMTKSELKEGQLSSL